MKIHKFVAGAALAAVWLTPAPSFAENETAELVATDQSEEGADIAVTQKIRQAVVADGSLSFTAKNVKIITIDGNVTLRGPVESEIEKNIIETLARNVSGAASIDNQLEVAE